MRGRRCFVHVGTHKTGTTSVQAFLAMNERTLCDAGILAASTGRPRHLATYPQLGNHNIAWQLNGDPRFDPGSGTLSGLIDEIERTAPDVAVISSEDFEYLHARPAALHEMAGALLAVGYPIEFIVYLRPQGEYARSLYATLRIFGLDVPFAEFLGAVLEHGSFTFAERWVFQFQYTKLLDVLSLAGQGRLHARRLRRSAPLAALLQDFTSIVQRSPEAAPFECFELPGRLNEMPARDDETVALGADDEGRLLARFAAENEDLAARYGMQLPVF